MVESSKQYIAADVQLILNNYLKEKAPNSYPVKIEYSDDGGKVIRITMRRMAKKSGSTHKQIKRSNKRK